MNVDATSEVVVVTLASELFMRAGSNSMMPAVFGGATSATIVSDMSPSAESS